MSGMDSSCSCSSRAWSVGSVYALVALGFVLIYKATGIINFAQGEFVLVGAYVCL